MASLDFTDSIGAVSLTTVAATAGRFRGWKALPASRGEQAHALGSGARYVYEVREARRVSLALEHIAYADQDIVERLLLHLDRGGTVTITTNDGSSNAYADMGLAEDTTPEVTGPDPETLDYAVSCILEYVGTGTPPALVCEY